MDKGCIYYTDFYASPLILQVCQKQLRESFNGEIISVSLNKPLDFGKNIVLKNKKRSYLTMVYQIILGLENSSANYVFFTEADVLYHKSHFDFMPSKDDIFYYNTNNWRWKYPYDLLITYDNLVSLSSLCVYRKLALDHYKKRLELIERNNWNENKSREPYWIRRIGYEPGNKSKRQELIPTNGCDYWKSKYPNIDIRHSKTFSPPKVSLDNFKHPPTNWIEKNIDEIPGWGLRKVFPEGMKKLC